MRDAKFRWVGDELLAGSLDSRADGDRSCQAQAEPEVVRLAGASVVSGGRFNVTTTSVAVTASDFRRG
jgi:hypothetical protein